METLTINITGKGRYDFLNGKEHIVVPVSMIVPGVLNGSNGPLYYPESILKKTVNSWNGMPLVLRHPMNGNIPISARSADILNSAGLGVVLSAKCNGKLTAEGWFDVDAVTNLDSDLSDEQKILPKLVQGIPIELSTGLEVSAVELEQEATHNGKAYQAEVVDLRPDHLAILPDSVGACSLADGCGVLVNSEPKRIANAPNPFFHFVANELSHEQLSFELNKALGDLFKQSDPSAWIVEVFDGFFVFRQSEDLFKISYTKTDSGVTLVGSPQKVMRETRFVEVNEVVDESVDDTLNTSVSNEENDMSKTKEELLAELTANCDCTKEKEFLASLNEDQLVSYQEMNRKDDKKSGKGGKGKLKEDVTNESQEKENSQPVLPVFTDNAGNRHTFDAGTGAWITEKPVTNETKTPVRKSLDDWMAEAPEEIQKVVANAIGRENEEKQQLIDKLVAHLEGDEQVETAKVFATNNVETLRVMVKAIPQKKQPSMIGSFIPEQVRNAKKPEPLGLPKIDWSEAAKS